MRDKLYEIHKETARFYYDILMSEKGAKAVAYLDERAVTLPTRRRFGLGYSGTDRAALYRYLSAKGYDGELLRQSGLVISDKKGGYFDRFSDRLMFPIFDFQGKIIGFGGRIIGKGEPKYLNSPETPIFSKSKSLYGINYARQSKAKALILVEGYMDVIALHQNGFTNSTASLGTAFNSDHASVLRKYCDSAILLFDSDEAGEKAVIRAIPVLSQAGLGVRALQLQGAKDPDEFLKKYGGEAFAKALENAGPAIIFQLKCLKKGFNLDDQIEKSRFTNEASALIAAITNSIERDIYAKELSKLAGVSIDAINAELLKLVDKKADEIKDFGYKNKPSVYSPNKLEKKYDEARRGLLSAMASSSGLAAEIAVCVAAEELITPEYIELYNILGSIYALNGNVVPADIISRFDTLESQKIISSIFSLRQSCDDESEYIKMLNQQITAVKLEYISHNMFELSQTDCPPEKKDEFDRQSLILFERKISLERLVSNQHKWLK
jgi:DNA primase